MSAAGDGGSGNGLEGLEAWLTALESMIALLAAQLPAPARERFATALREQEATRPEINARLSWSASLNRVRSLISEDGGRPPDRPAHDDPEGANGR
jgi:hypothetical protein